MKNHIIISSILLFLCFTCEAQMECWAVHWNEDTTLFGYKTEDGEIKILPKYNDFAYVSGFDNFHQKFESFVAVGETEGDLYKSFYLTKSGNTFGEDSLYFSPSGFIDCENEGFIRFIDSNGLVGLFDSNGKIVIPPIYDELSKVHNGIVWARKDANKVYDEDDPEEFSFINGQHILLDTSGDLIIRNFNNGYYYPFDEIDPYSMEISVEENHDSKRISFFGENNDYYTFSKYKFTFRAWVEDSLFSFFTSGLFNEILADSVNCRGYFSGNNYLNSTNISSMDLLNDHFETIQYKLMQVSKTNMNWFIVKSELNPLTYSRTNYSMYYDNCGKPKDKEYPVMLLIVNRDNGRQDKYSFLRIDENKYKLIGLKFDRN